MKMPWIAGIFLLTPCFTHAAQAELEACALTDDAAARLVCYDAAMNRPDPTSAITAGAGKWQVSDKTNPLDDTRTVILALPADSGGSRFRGQVTLIARCQSNDTEAYIVWGEYLGSEANVTTRIGKNQAVTREWSLSTDSLATFKTGDVVGFLRQIMREGPSFVAQVTPYNESPVTAVFDTSGMEEAIKPLEETCAWPEPVAPLTDEEYLRLLGQ